MLRLQPGRNRLAALAQLADPLSYAERPVHDLPLRACFRVERGRDAGVDLLVKARHAREHRGPDDRERLGDLERIGAERNREPEIGPEQVDQPAEVVRERQKEQDHVARGEDVVRRLGLLAHRVVVAVPDHAALGRSGRAGGVDEREQVVLVDLGGGFLDRARVL